MTHIDILKQALEALEEAKHHMSAMGAPIAGVLDAIASIRQAIADAEKQEPVAHLLRRQDRDGYETGEKTDYGAIPVYTRPQPKQEQDLDYKAIGQQAYEAGYTTGYMDGAIKAHEAKQEQGEPVCRDDGRCQYAIDSGAEGEGHCPKGKCVMLKQEQGEPVAHLLRRQDRDGYETGEKTDYGAIPVYTYPQPKQEQDLDYKAIGQQAYEAGYTTGYMDGAIKAHEAKQEQGGPVCDKDPQGCYSVRCHLGNKCKNTPQPKREPLTDERIQDLKATYLYSVQGYIHGETEFARAIEAAHGIKE